MQRSIILSSFVLLGAGLIQFACVQDFDQFDPGKATGGAGGEVAGSSSSSSGTGGSSSSSSSSSGSTSSSSSSSSASSSSSSTGGMPCMNSGDCPNDTDCINWSCTMSVCVQTFRPQGTQANDPTNGDCKTDVCDGMGGTMSVIDNGDTPPGDGNPCTTSKCENGVPMNVNDPVGDPCNNGGKCNSMAMCVECIADADCPAVGATCYMEQCVSCTDGMMNGDETGVDCGGSCKKCNGTTCAMGTECGSGNCVDTVCCNETCTGDCKSCNINGSAGTCTSIALNGTDNSPQCGGNNVCDGNGACKLKLGESCNNDADCASGKCTGMGGKTCTQ